MPNSSRSELEQDIMILSNFIETDAEGMISGQLINSIKTLLTLATQYLAEQEKCPKCKGMKKVDWHYLDGSIKMEDCPKCQGTGTLAKSSQGCGEKIEPLEEVGGRYKTPDNATLYDFIVENRRKINQIISALNKEKKG